MALGDIFFSAFNVDTNIYGASNLAQHFSAEFPSGDWIILGTGANPAKGTGGKGKTRMIVFAMKLS